MLFRELWADSSDTLAYQYTGTGAMKSLYTRTGERTFGGLCDDFGKSMSRIYQDNYINPQKQVVIEGILREGSIIDAEDV